MPTSFTQEQYDALCAAIATGALTVSYGDESITYQSLEKMIQLRNLMAGELGLSVPIVRVFTNFNKGFKFPYPRRKKF